MTTTLVVMAVVAAVAAGLAWWDQRRRRPAPTAIAGTPPGSVDRNDFRSPDAPLLIAVFTSKTCSSCEAVWNELAGYESATVVTQNVEVIDQAELHHRYKIESVPTAIIVDATGETQAGFVGPLGPEHREALRTIVAAHD